MNEMKWYEIQSITDVFVIKKTFVIGCQTLLKVQAKVALIFLNFSRMKVIKMKSRAHLDSKVPYSTNQDIFSEIQ